MDFNFLLGEDYEIIDDDRLYVINGGSCTSGGAGSAAPSGGGGSGSTSTPSGCSSATTTNTSETPKNVPSGIPQASNGNNQEEEKRKQEEYRQAMLEKYYEGIEIRNTLMALGSFKITVKSFFKDMKDSFVHKILNSNGIVKITKFHFEDRDKLNEITESFDEILNEAQKKENKNWELMNFNMSKYHQNGEGQAELKFICRDGREAVFTQDFSDNGKYELYSDPNYKGTYNYCTPGFVNDPWYEKAYKGVGHFFADMVPYYMTGDRNERNQ